MPLLCNRHNRGLVVVMQQPSLVLHQRDLNRANVVLGSRGNNRFVVSILLCSCVYLGFATSVRIDLVLQRAVSVCMHAHIHTQSAPCSCAVFYGFRVMRMDAHVRMHTYNQDQQTYTIGLCNIRRIWLSQAIMSIALPNAIFLPTSIAIFLPTRSQGFLRVTRPPLDVLIGNRKPERK